VFTKPKPGSLGATGMAGGGGGGGGKPFAAGGRRGSAGGFTAAPSAEEDALTDQFQLLMSRLGETADAVRAGHRETEREITRRAETMADLTAKNRADKEAAEKALAQARLEETEAKAAAAQADEQVGGAGGRGHAGGHPVLFFAVFPKQNNTH
jgi:hypothetical protein